MSKKFDPALIEIRNNPFSSTKSVSISIGRYMKNATGSDVYIPLTDQVVEIGILRKLRDRVKIIEEGQAPEHILVLAEYGQGKSFSLKGVQDDIYISYNGVILAYTIGRSSSSIEKDDNKFQNKIMEDLEAIFQNIDPALYTNKSTIEARYKLSTQPKNFGQFLAAYDKAFHDLKILVYIFIDELDKVVVSELTDDKVRLFLEDVKSIADNCGKSISLFVAGTPNCLVKMRSLSFDYNQRFTPIEDNFLTLDECEEYIVGKFKLKLDFAGHYPFDKRTRSNIHKISKGNIRKIEALSRELWNYSSRERKQISPEILTKYLTNKLFATVKHILGAGVHDVVINFVILLFVSGGKAGTLVATRGLSINKRKLIDLFLAEDSCPVKKIGHSYTLSLEMVEKIGDALIS